ncbi:MAG: nuclear transport factor 2 family protein [Aigarchaeota archaeon]|nr:nuclear transport factor 2 family protein [Candidatus Pelearchaeum maunauluense]
MSNPVDEIKSRILAVPEALKQRDADTILRIYDADDPRFTAFEDHPPYHRIDGQAFKRFVNEVIGKLEELRIDRKDIRIDVFDGFAVATGVDEWSAKIEGQALSGVSRFTLVFRKTSDGWRVVHEHFSIVPSGS